MYIWEKEVSSVNQNTVRFTDETEVNYTDKQLTYIMTEEAKDPSQFREHILQAILPELEMLLSEEDVLVLGKKMFDILEDHDVTNGELQSILRS